LVRSNEDELVGRAELDLQTILDACTRTEFEAEGCFSHTILGITKIKTSLAWLKLLFCAIQRLPWDFFYCKFSPKVW